ncbi:unnamed protein product [Somion occarium]|uniref:Uncharacterized protein n=1 Tax=Somion occarium TaxID=3059160 RepID=A0ABP1CSM6_9APHY
MPTFCSLPSHLAMMPFDPLLGYRSHESRDRLSWPQSVLQSDPSATITRTRSCPAFGTFKISASPTLSADLRALDSASPLPILFSGTIQTLSPFRLSQWNGRPTIVIELRPSLPSVRTQ